MSDKLSHIKAPEYCKEHLKELALGKTIYLYSMI